MLQNISFTNIFSSQKFARKMLQHVTNKCIYLHTHTSLIFQYSQCLFSYQIFTKRSFSPDVAKRVPSGLNARCCTGVAVFAFHTHCHWSWSICTKKTLTCFWKTLCNSQHHTWWFISFILTLSTICIRFASYNKFNGLFVRKLWRHGNNMWL